ncbi:hypothetical protein AB6A40_011674 [Gnathostoma spinigerum]|uniref:Uncharacterized protein n=1 Tax=Gnathostoma spinigerum TaxID=75299 RepID=A0ABD6EYC8_9BILA
MVFYKVFNCSTTASNKTNDCALIDKSKMLSLYRQANTVESSIRMTYALAVIGAKLERNETIRDSCLRSDPECTDVLIHTLENMDYEFGENDPEELMGTRLQFHQTSDGDYMSNGIVIEGIEFVDDELKGPMVYKVCCDALLVENSWRTVRYIVTVCDPTTVILFISSSCTWIYSNASAKTTELYVL